MEITVRFTVEQLSLIESILKIKLKQAKQDTDVLNLYKKIYMEALQKIQQILYVPDEQTHKKEYLHPRLESKTKADIQKSKQHALEALFASL